MKIRRLFFLMLLSVPTLAFAQQQYYGTIASGIRVEGADPADRDRISLRAGDVIRPENVRAAIQALFDTGRYRSVEVDAVSADNGTALTFNVTPHYFFGTFTLIPESLLGRPLSTLVRVPVGQKYSETQVQEIVAATKQILEEAGYFNVTLTVRSEHDDVRRLQNIELIANTDDKSKARISAIDIEGANGILPPSDLSRALHISTGDVYSAANVDRGVSAIQQKFLDKNFLNTRVEAAPEYNAETNTVKLGITIRPGQETVIDTGQQIPEDEIRKLVPIFEEGFFDPDLIREGRARIVEYLQQKGYFEAIVEDPETIPATDGNPARIIFSIKPGDRHRVKSVQFRGNIVFTSEELQKVIRVQPWRLPDAGTLQRRTGADRRRHYSEHVSSGGLRGRVC